MSQFLDSKLGTIRWPGIAFVALVGSFNCSTSNAASIRRGEEGDLGGTLHNLEEPRNTSKAATEVTVPIVVMRFILRKQLGLLLTPLPFCFKGC